LGKDGNAYLLNRTNLGGVSAPVAQAHISSSMTIQAAATYTTPQGTYVVCRATATQVSAFRISATAPPSIINAWVVSQNGHGSPFVTSSDGTKDAVVWVVGSEGDQRLHGFDGDTGSVVFSGGGANELMAGTRRFNTGIVARGRIYIANDSRVYAFTVPVASIVLTNLEVSANGTFQFGFTNNPGMTFSVFATTDVSLPFSNWSRLGTAEEISPGQFRFVDPQPATAPQRFYRVTAP
jgi:hypothetical protein